MNLTAVDQRPEASTIEAPLTGLNPGLNQDLDAEILVAGSLAPAAPGPMWLRLAYTLEFLIALLAIINLWSEIGGEGHLELMPWHIKLVCIVGLAWCSIRFTASMVEQREFWTRRTIRWLTGIILFCIAMGGITYYYHLQEVPDEDDADTSTARLSISVSKISADDAH